MALTAALTLATTVLCSVGVAGAVHSYHGSDFSQDYDARHRIRACDQEADSNKVKAGWSVYLEGGETDAITDHDGANGVCATMNIGAGVIRKHHTCERNLLSWDCGNWQAT